LKQTFFDLSISIQLGTAKANKCLYFLKQLKRAGVPTDQLLHFYVAVIRPVLEYCTPVWHYAITHTQTEQIESIQKRAIRIFFPSHVKFPTHTHCLLLISTLCIPDEVTTKSFFQDICDPSSCIHHLLPPPRDTFVLSRLRTVTPLSRLSSRTKKHCSFIIYTLNNYQESTQLTTNLTILT